MEITGEGNNQVRENAARLKCARKSQSLSVSGACAVLGIAPATLKRWEAGSGTPGACAIEKILDSWGLPAESALRASRVEENIGRKIAWSVEQTEARPVLRLLRHKRRRNHLSLDEVASATGVGVASLQRYETGLRIPTGTLLESISAAVGCSAEESQLLHQSLASNEPSSVPLAVGEIFSRPNANPGFWIFRELDFVFRFHQQQTPAEVDSRLKSVMLGLAFSGDYAALLETWQEAKAFARKGGPLGALHGMLSLAKMHVARRPKEAISEFVNLRKEIPHEPRTNDQINATFSAIRMAQILGDHEDADEMLGRVERDCEFEAPGKVSCGVYRHLINFSLGESTEAVPALQELRKETHPVLAYTTLVAELSILTKKGQRQDAMEVLKQCRKSEESYGLGSPMAKKLGMSLLSA